MLDLRAQNLALYALLHGLKPAASRFAIPREALQTALNDLLEDASHPFFAALRTDLKNKVNELGTEKMCELYHFSPMLVELLALSGESEGERATDYTCSPENLSDRNPLHDFDSPQKEVPKDPPESPKTVPISPTDSPCPKHDLSLDSESDLAVLCKRSFKARLQRAVEWYKQGISAELLSDKLHIPNKYKIHMEGNWSQLPSEKIVELGATQCAVKQLCERGYTRMQVERVFQSLPRSLIKVMYDSSCSLKRRKDPVPS